MVLPLKSVIYAFNMKKIILYALLSLLGLGMAQNICAQEDSLPVKTSDKSSSNPDQDDWIHDKKGIYSFGVGGTQGIAAGSNYYYGGGTLTSLAMAINISGEYKLWHYIGLGFQTGINYYPYRYYTGFDIPIMIKANVHILDAANLDIAEDLDVYAGLGVGAGPAVFEPHYYVYGVTRTGITVGAVIHVGPQVGIRYWTSERFAIFGEFGWGATFANAGITF
jgi:hypothetical protein